MVCEVGKIGIFIESPRFLQHALYLSKDTDIDIVTTSKEVYKKLSCEADSVYFFKKEKLTDYISFKRKMHHLAFDCVILFNDSSPVSYWIQKQSHTITVFDDSMFGRDIFYYKVLFLTFSRNRSIVESALQYFLGPSAEINGRLHKILPNKIVS